MGWVGILGESFYMKGLGPAQAGTIWAIFIAYVAENSKPAIPGGSGLSVRGLDRWTGLVQSFIDHLGVPRPH